MTPTPEPTELDCSAGAKMMIERMQTNPEDFEVGGKLYRVYENHRMSVRDKKAVGDAYCQYIVEPQLMAAVLVALTAPEEEAGVDGKVKFKTQGRYTTPAIDPRAIYGNVTANLEGARGFDPNTLTTYNTATQQLISHEMIEQQRRHLADHKEKLRYMQEEAIREGKLGWPEKFRGMI
jgi:hypothetical protein